MFAEELRLLDKRFQQRNQLGALEVKEESRKRKLETPRFEPTHSRHPDLQLNDQPTAPLKLRYFSIFESVLYSVGWSNARGDNLHNGNVLDETWSLEDWYCKLQSNHAVQNMTDWKYDAYLDMNFNWWWWNFLVPKLIWGIYPNSFKLDQYQKSAKSGKKIGSKSIKISIFLSNISCHRK